MGRLPSGQVMEQVPPDSLLAEQELPRKKAEGAATATLTRAARAEKPAERPPKHCTPLPA